MKITSLRSILIGAAFIVLPLFYSSWLDGGDPVRYGKLMGLALLGAVALAAYVSREGGKFLGAASLFASLNTIILGNGYLLQETNLIFQLSLILSLYCSKMQVNDILKILIIGGAIPCLMSLLQIADLDPIFHYIPGTLSTLPCAFFGQQTLNGPWMALCVVAAVWLGWFPIAALYTIVVLATRSSFSYACLGAGLTVVLYHYMNRRKFLMLFGALLITFLMLGMALEGRSFFENNGRFTIWKVAYSYVVHSGWRRILLGFGFGSFSAIFPQIEPEIIMRVHGAFEQAHNEYLQLFFEGGIAGLGVFVVILVAFLKRCFAMGKEGLIVLSLWSTMAVNALGNFPAHVVPHGFLWIFCFVIVLARPSSLQLLNGGNRSI